MKLNRGIKKSESIDTRALFTVKVVKWGGAILQNALESNENEFFKYAKKKKIQFSILVLRFNNGGITTTNNFVFKTISLPRFSSSERMLFQPSAHLISRLMSSAWLATPLPSFSIIFKCRGGGCRFTSTIHQRR